MKKVLNANLEGFADYLARTYPGAAAPSRVSSSSV
jgi:hypothetical protein